MNICTQKRTGSSLTSLTTGSSLTSTHSEERRERLSTVGLKSDLCAFIKRQPESKVEKNITEFRPSVVVEIGSHVAKAGLEPLMPLPPEPGMMLVYSYNTSTGGVEAGGSSSVQEQPKHTMKPQASHHTLSYSDVTLCY